MASRIVSIVVLVSWTLSAFAEEVVPPAAFAVVMIDARTEAALGAFPYDRGVYARGVEALAAAGARGVVLKFFIDAPKAGDGDAALAAAMGKVKVIVQARLDPSEAKPNALPERFTFERVSGGEGAKPLSAEAGWLPVPAVAERAYDLGFIDSTPSVELVPAAQRYRGRWVKSLYVAAIELAAGKTASVVAGKSLEVGGKTVATDGRCFAKVALPKADGLKFYSFVDLVAGRVPAEGLKDRVVIVGYDGAKMPMNETPIGKVKGHRLFCYQLFSLWREVGSEEPRR